MITSRLSKSRTVIMSGTLLAAIQNAVLFLWSCILLIGISSQPVIMLNLGIWTNYLAFSIDLIALPLLGVGFYLFSQCYDIVSRLARTTGLLFVGWALPSFIWRFWGGLFSRTGAEDVVRNMNPQMVAQTLTQVFDGIYIIFAISSIILSLALYNMNELMGKLLEDVGAIESGRRRIYTSFATTNLVAIALIAFTFLWIDLVEVIPLKFLTSALLLGGSALIILFVVVRSFHSGHNIVDISVLTALSLTVIWVLLIEQGSFGYLTSGIIIGATATVIIRQRNKNHPTKIWRVVGMTGLAMIAAVILFTSWVGLGTLENSTGAGWLVITSLSLKGPLLALLGMVMFSSVHQAFRELPV